MGKVFVIAELGINHNGDMDIVKKMIDCACEAGCSAVKFQKRTIDKVYTKEYLDSYRESPWGRTQREQKTGLELTENQYLKIDKYCKEKNIEWLASAWDVEAQFFLRKFNLKYNKIAAAMLTNLEFIKIVAEEKRYTFISTGMSTWKEIDKAVDIFKRSNCPFELMHTVSVYPMAPEEANLLMIPELKRRYDCKVGFSAHEMGNIASLAAVAMGATSIERHFTLSRNLYGSDQSSSIEPEELKNLIQKMRIIEKALGNGKRVLSEREMETRKKLRGV